MNYPNWYISKIENLIELGFFDDESISEVAERIVQGSINNYFGPILNLENEKLIEQIISSYDYKKCWFVEDWMLVGAEFENVFDFYLNVFLKLKEISSGKFNPENIRISECGYTEGGQERLKIEFSLEMNQIMLVFSIDSEALILTFLQELNEYTSTTGDYYFETIWNSYGPCFIYCLSEKQRKELSQIFGWKYYVGNNYWFDKANYLKEIESYEQAILTFQKSISYNQYPSYYFDFGNFLLERNNVKRAIEVFQEGVAFLKCQNDDFNKKEWWIKMFESELNSIKN